MSNEWQAGRALDAEIARRLFGIKRLYSSSGQPWGGPPDDWPMHIPSGKAWRTHSIDAKPLPWFSRDIAAAWQIIERLGDLGACCSRITRECIVGHVQVDVTITMQGERPGDHAGEYRASAEDAPLAICRAALAVLDGGEPR